jgi:hypothetical protein
LDCISEVLLAANFEKKSLLGFEAATGISFGVAPLSRCAIRCMRKA